MQIDILMETINVLKKDPRISQKPLKAREKAAIADALKGKYPLRRLLSALSLGKSSYFYAEKAKPNPDKHAALKARLRDEFRKTEGFTGTGGSGNAFCPNSAGCPKKSSGGS